VLNKALAMASWEWTWCGREMGGPAVPGAYPAASGCYPLY
jgi:hypothetical protein